MTNRIVDALNRAGIPVRVVNGQLIPLIPDNAAIVQMVVNNWNEVYSQIESARGFKFTGDK